MFADLPLEIIGEIAGESRSVYHALVLVYPRFARSLTLGDRLDFAEKFGYDCRVVAEKCIAFVWTLDGCIHRTDGPAVVFMNGTQAWYQHGIHHRGNAPAVITTDGCCWWYKHGKLHRNDGPAVSGPRCSEWYQHGKRHREDGPAIINKIGNYWYLDGKRHREGGPAVEYNSGHTAWLIRGVAISTPH